MENDQFELGILTINHPMFHVPMVLYQKVSHTFTCMYSTMGSTCVFHLKSPGCVFFPRQLRSVA